MPELGLDWFFIAVLLGSLALGAWRGLFYEVLSLLSWIAAFLLAQWFAPSVSEMLPMSGASELIRHAAAFVLIFVVAAFAGGMLARLIQKLVSRAGLQSTDRALGALFGLLRGALLLLAVTIVMSMTPFKHSGAWKESVGAGTALAALQNLKPIMPPEFGKYLP